MATIAPNETARWAGQRYGANYAAPFPGEHVTLYARISDAADELALDCFGCTGDTILLWAVDAHDSEAEAKARTLSDAAHADRLLTLGPRGGVKVEHI